MTRPTLFARGIAAIITSLLAASLAAQPCADPATDGIGSAGDPLRGGIGGTSEPARGGIGGTGAPIDLAAGGIGGTGQAVLPISAGEAGAVVGTITGFASICVNGLEVHYEDALPVSINGRLAATDALAVGQVVAVQVAQSPRGLEATKLDVVHAVIGPVTRRDGDALLVMGQRVLVAGDSALPEIGQTVRVSGLRDVDGNIVASRLDAAPGETEQSVIGRVRGGRIEGLEIEAAELPDEADVLVRGRFVDGRLRAREIRRDPVREVGDRARAVSFETRVIERRGALLETSGRRIKIDDETRVTGGRRDEIGRNRLVRVTGRVDDQGAVRAERLELRREVFRDSLDRRDADGGESRREGLGNDSDGERPERNRPERDERRGKDDVRAERGPGERRERPETERMERVDSETARRERFERAERPEGVERPERPERPERD